VAERKRLDGWDVIVDCTAEDAVLRAMCEHFTQDDYGAIERRAA